MIAKGYKHYPRHIKIIKVNLFWVMKCWQSVGPLAHTVKGIPLGTNLVGTHVDTYTPDVVNLVVEHPDFPTVGEGCPIPELIVEFQIVPIKEQETLS